MHKKNRQANSKQEGKAKEQHKKSNNKRIPK